MSQMNLLDFDRKGFDPPPLWRCMKTCKHANEYTDTFPVGGGKRCLYGQKFVGTSGNDTYEKTVNGLVYFHCKFYEEET